MKFLYQSLFACCYIFTACSNQSVPLQSTMHTESVHHIWTDRQSGDNDSLKISILDLRDVYNSYYVLNKDTFLFTPRFGYNNRISFNEVKPIPTLGTESKGAGVSLLQKAYRYSLSGDHLNLYNKDQELLGSYVINYAMDSVNLWHKWKLTKMINANDDTLQLAEAYICFYENKSGIAFAGCNTIRFSINKVGSYDLSLGNFSTTEMYCRQFSVIEEIMLKALPLVKKYQVIGNRLKLFDKDNGLLFEGVNN